VTAGRRDRAPGAWESHVQEAPCWAVQWQSQELTSVVGMTGLQCGHPVERLTLGTSQKILHTIGCQLVLQRSAVPCPVSSEAPRGGDGYPIQKAKVAACLRKSVSSGTLKVGESGA
jgi:hypothetical protein